MQLNAGGRQVAEDRNWQVVDFERLASWFVDPKARWLACFPASCCATSPGEIKQRAQGQPHH